MSSAPTGAEIARDARWLVQALDLASEQVRLIEMSRDDYRHASFLDDRMLQRPVNAHVASWPAVASTMSEDARQDARWIFHIGHVGSTLVARLLGELDHVLSIREPRILRDITAASLDQRKLCVAPVRKLLSRTRAPDEIALVKATSFVSEIAAELVPPDGRAMFMYATPRNYIASILAGENSVQELRMLTGSRTQRMASRVPALPQQSSDAGLAALAWACEMTALEGVAEAMPDRRIAWADFDAMLADMESELARVADFLGFSASQDRLASIARGPLMARYSKAPEYAYSPSLRHELIGKASAHHRREIDDALAMLRGAAEKSPLLGQALTRAGEA